MKIKVMSLVFVFLVSTLMIPVGMSYAQYGSGFTASSPTVIPPTTNKTVTNMTMPTSITPGTTGNVVGGVMAYMAKASDGTIVIVRSAHPLSGQPLSLGIAFQGSTGNFVSNQNYAMTVTQDNVTVLSVPTGYASTGTDTQTTSALASSNPINIHVTLNGVGLPTASPSTWTGVKGEVLVFGQTPSATTNPSMSNMTMNAPSTPVTPSAQMSPLKQFKAGVTAKSVQCQSGFSLIVKAEDGSPACVHSSTVQVLILRGWATAQ